MRTRRHPKRRTSLHAMGLGTYEAMVSFSARVDEQTTGDPWRAESKPSQKNMPVSFPPRCTRTATVL